MQRNLLFPLLGLASVLALVLVVVLLPSESEPPAQDEPQTNLSKEAEAAPAVVDAVPGSSETETSDRVEEELNAPAAAEDGFAFGGFPVLVLDVDGSPAVDVIVCASRGDPAMDWRHLMYSTLPVAGFRTNAQGQVHLPYPDGGAQPVLIGARRHGASAMERRERDEISETDAWVLQLESSPSMLVRLLDPYGKPVPDQNVVWWQDATSQDSGILHVKTNDQGEARFDALRRIHDRGALLGTSFGVAGAYVERPRRVVQELELAQGEIELQIPETGAIRVSIRYEDGGPLSRTMSAKLTHAVDPESSHNEFFRWQQADGIDENLDGDKASFDTVEIGQVWQFAVLPRFFSPPITTEIVGPTQPGELVEMEFVLPPDPLSRHTMLLLSPAQEPLADIRVNVSVGMSGQGGSSNMSGSSETDAEGMLVIDMPSAPSPEKWTLDISMAENGQALRWNGAGTATDTDHDMPHQVTLREIPRIAAGQAVYADGTPVTDYVYFDLGVRKAGQEVESVGSFMNVANQVGKFDLRSDSFPSGQAVVSARMGEVTRWTDLDVAVGQEGVTIILPTQGWFAVDAGENQRGLFAKLKMSLTLPGVDPTRPSEQDIFSSQSVERGEALQSTPLPISQAHSRTTPIACLQGPLQWIAKDQFERILFREDFDLPPGSSRKEPHLRTLPKLPLQRYTLIVRARDGKVLPNAHALYPLSSRSRSGVSIRNGRAQFVCAELPPQMTVSAPGFVEQTVDWSGPELEVILEPGP